MNLRFNGMPIYVKRAYPFVVFPVARPSSDLLAEPLRNFRFELVFYSLACKGFDVVDTRSLKKLIGFATPRISDIII